MENREEADQSQVTTSTLGRLRWSEEMNNDLLECKRKAKQLNASENPPRNANGRKKGYMKIMKELWDELGYADMFLSSQNLRDQAARLEKTTGNVRETIVESVGYRETESVEENTEFEERINSEIQSTSAPSTENLDLHNLPSMEAPVGPNTLTGNTETESILKTAYPIFTSEVQSPGDFTKRSTDTRTKRKPSDVDIANINKAISELLKQNNTVDPAENPFGWLWLANCILYAVVIAFLIYKGWKKQGRTQEHHRRKDVGQKLKEEFEQRAKEIRRKISIAKAEFERILENRKITKKGRKNRAMLEKECNKISAAGLVSYMERKKSDLRKLKRTYRRKMKQEKSSELNKRFQADPGAVYACMKKMIEKDGNSEKPKYEVTSRDEENNQNRFENIEEASSYWKSLWESEGTGNTEAEWLEDVRAAISDHVPSPSQERYELDTNCVVSVILKKRNWSAPGPDRIASFWWKKAQSLHEGVARSFKAVFQEDHDYPWWFTEGKTSLIPKPGEFSSDNQRPITCLNTAYKWHTSCVLKPMDQHLDKYGLMQGEQRGAKEKCSGTIDNLLIDRMVCQDSRRGKRNLSMAWIDVKKAYDSIDHEWLREMMILHRFPEWIGRVVQKLSIRWNTRIKARTKQGDETSEVIRFNKGLPQGDGLCPRLFTLCINPIAWKLKATEGYRLSKPISKKITDLLYIDDLKVFAASSGKLGRVLRSTKSEMADVGLQWNERKCSVVHVKRGELDTRSVEMEVGESDVITSLKEGAYYKFLGVMENVKQDDSRVLKCAAKVYLQRLSVIWSSPLSDFNKALATNQFALPTLSYLMWTQVWPIAELQRLDRETRKVISENGGKHPLGSTALMYLPRKSGGRGLKSVEHEYKLIKIKAAVKLYANTDETMTTVRDFEKKAERVGSQSLTKDAIKYAEELNMMLSLEYPEPKCRTRDGEEISGRKIGVWAKVAQQKKYFEEMREEKWQGKLFKNRWEDDDISSDCFGWMSGWRTAPSHTIAGVHELYQQLLPTKIYHQKKTRLNTSSDVQCRLCGKTPESLPHILAGCSALAQTKYLARHNAALKVLFFEMLRDRELISSVPPWYSPAKPKPVYENERATAFWDIPLYAENTEVRANRIDARIIDKIEKKVIVIEMSCPWIENRQLKDEEKTQKYGPLRWELKRQFPGYQIIQHNIIIDVLGGYSKEVEKRVKTLIGVRSGETLRRMQKAVLCNSLNIARSFKVLVE